MTNTSTSSDRRRLTLTSLVDDRGTATTGDDVDLLTNDAALRTTGTITSNGDTDSDYWSTRARPGSSTYTTDVPLNRAAASLPTR